MINSLEHLTMKEELDQNFHFQTSFLMKFHCQMKMELELLKMQKLVQIQEEEEEEEELN